MSKSPETDEETMSKSPVPVGKKRNEETIISDSKTHVDQDSSSKSSGKECKRTLKPAVGKKRNVDESSKSTLDGIECDLEALKPAVGKKRNVDESSKSTLDGKECDQEALKPDGKKRNKNEERSESVLVGKTRQDNDDDDDEELQLLKIVLEYSNTTFRDPHHGTTCMTHFYEKWLKWYDYPQASRTTVIDLTDQITELWSRYEEDLIEFPGGEVSVEDENRLRRDNPVGLKKFRLAHEIWKHTRGIDRSCNYHCLEDFSPDESDENED